MNANNVQKYNVGRNQQARNQTHRDQRFKFDSDFDFEKANEKFHEQLTGVEKLLSNTNLESKIKFYVINNWNLAESNNAGETYSNQSRNLSPVSNNTETFYNKQTSFFDNISCEAIEKEEGCVFNFFFNLLHYFAKKYKTFLVKILVRIGKKSVKRIKRHLDIQPFVH